MPASPGFLSRLSLGHASGSDALANVATRVESLAHVSQRRRDIAVRRVDASRRRPTARH